MINRTPHSRFFFAYALALVIFAFLLLGAGLANLASGTYGTGLTALLLAGALLGFAGAYSSAKLRNIRWSVPPGRRPRWERSALVISAFVVATGVIVYALADITTAVLVAFTIGFCMLAGFLVGEKILDLARGREPDLTKQSKD